MGTGDDFRLSSSLDPAIIARLELAEHLEIENEHLRSESKKLKAENEQLKEANRDDICRMLKIEQKWIDTNEQLKEENERLKQLLQDWNIRFKE